MRTITIDNFEYEIDGEIIGLIVENPESITICLHPKIKLENYVGKKNE